jgi:hypothetical protein
MERHVLPSAGAFATQNLATMNIKRIFGPAGLTENWREIWSRANEEKYLESNCIFGRSFQKM